ncbi:MAG: DUF2892 domain-containing protein [Gammaproteobacteria bacterium]|nr:DUF2892 domain-containing protein [Gammaproteobacteria bacterium]
MEERLQGNVTLAERSIRLVLGAGVLFYFFVSPIEPVLFTAVVVGSLYTLLTSLTGWDPLYGLMNAILALFKPESFRVSNSLGFQA